ncbi:ABC transporter permease [Halorubrum distributum]|uniref:Uncharacterized protein n=1 Tax=Halorubrum distributum JCM 13916 TaxID=1230455 RepID=M0PRU9_9EURY|nr:ABC transporter permease [Halorubrum arcis]EMA72676.1 hypothetical protein C462_00272 [Halorubrum arcis JCM 13916]
MSWSRDVGAVALADFRERSRTSKLIVIPVVLAYFAKLVTVDSTLVVGNTYTGVPTAAWYGGLVAGIGTTVLLLFGYPLIHGSIAHDRTTNVAEFVASAPLSNSSYLVGKWLSNFTLLAVVTGLLFGATVVSFLLQGTGPFNPVDMGAPFILLTLPTMAVVSAAGVCFETLDTLRGTGGTVLYFLLAIVGVIGSIPPESPVDLTGLVALRQSMASSIAAQYPGFEGSIISFAYTDTATDMEMFRWAGLSVGSALLSRVPIFVITGGLLGVSVLSFDRFDDTQTWSLGLFDHGSSDAEATAELLSPPLTELSRSGSDGDISLASVTTRRFHLRRVFIAELKMALRGHRRLWYAGMIVALVSAAVAPLKSLRSIVIPIALLLPLPVWSQLGAREQIHRTQELIFATSNPLRLLAVSYLVGISVGTAVISPALVRYVLIGSSTGLLGAVTAVLFLPAAALAAGIWSGRPTLFEIGYLVAWYLGPMNGLGLFDYVGATQPPGSIDIQIGYLVAAVVALIIASIGRQRQLA